MEFCGAFFEGGDFFGEFFAEVDGFAGVVAEVEEHGRVGGVWLEGLLVGGDFGGLLWGDACGAGAFEGVAAVEEEFPVAGGDGLGL